MSVRVLALDIADRTGWALHEEDGHVASGVLDLGIRLEEHPGERLARARAEIHDLALHAKWIAWEAVVNFKGSFSKASLFGIEAQVVETAWRVKAETKTVMPSSLKKFMTGNDRAEKPDMIVAAAKRWHLARTDLGPDEADALCVLAWTLEQIKVPA